VIAIVTSEPHERNALAALCQAPRRDTTTFSTLRAFRRALSSRSVRVVIVRQKLADGYSDDLIAGLQSSDSPRTRIIVLAGANISSSIEARQLTLGADCVLRDPIRPEVLQAYLAKYTVPATPPSEGSPSPRPASAPFEFAGAQIDPSDRQLRFRARHTRLTPREVTLARLLSESPGRVVTYSTLYDEVLDRPFRGDTSNMRVLLGKLVASAGAVGLSLRPCIEVIAKSGYRYALPTRR
jgi:DNA-binding response OmpR family regulator